MRRRRKIHAQPKNITLQVYLGMFKSDRFVDVSLNQWLRRLPPETVTSHLNLNQQAIAKIPSGKEVIIPGYLIQVRHNHSFAVLVRKALERFQQLRQPRPRWSGLHHSSCRTWGNHGLISSYKSVISRC
jgi:hypothetical protein